MAREGAGVGLLCSSTGAQRGLEASAFGHRLRQEGWLGSNYTRAHGKLVCGGQHAAELLCRDQALLCFSER